ncbi:MAG: phosphoribosylformylglycinamidine synthase subunit PurS [Acidobacteriia bacterium]|nr:phosphoribosylformylglycinamidine synthase subunit PurS [Methyloceanibacter sp.]MCL6493015.1 phosphoribosylformylglycinamidine synthase subunit PurS [Terriglobia bacterium]
MKAVVTVMPRDDVLDPQGKAVAQALHSLGFADVGDVRVGKTIVLELATTSAAEARSEAEAMARKLLANPVIEQFEVEIKDA